MADTKLSALTEDTSPTTDDLVYTVTDPAGTPVSKKVTLANIAVLVWNYLTSLTAKTTLVDADQISIADSAASNVAKKITWQNLMVMAAAYTQTLTNKTLTAPTIADFTNANHDHGDADDGGVIVSASTTVAGKVELAITSEIDTASDDTRAMPPGQFRTSKFATQRIRGTLASPGTYYTTNGAVLPIVRADSALTITRIHIFGNDSTPTSELAGDLKFADDQFTGSLANATVIDVCDTTSGAFTATSSFDDATVPSGKYIYFQFDSAPHADWLRVTFEIYFTYD